jgi:hypothetical protein
MSKINDPLKITSINILSHAVRKLSLCERGKVSDYWRVSAAALVELTIIKYIM